MKTLFSALSPLRVLAALAVVVTGIAFAPSLAAAQTDTSYFVGAIPKTAINALHGSAVNVVAVSGATQTLTFPASGDATYDVTLSANCTFTVNSAATVSGVKQTISLIIRNPSGTFTTTLPTVKWNNGAAPTIITTAGTVLNFQLSTDDAGTTLLAK